MKRIRIFIIAIAILMALLPVSVCRSFTINPLKYHLTLSPGTTNSDVSLTINNPSDEKMAFKIKILSARQNENGNITYSKLNLPAESWVVPDQQTIEIPPQTSSKINYRISVPLSAAAGSYYLGLAAESSLVNSEKTVGVSAELVSVLLLQVSGVVNESLSINKWEIPDFRFAREWPGELSLINTSVTEVPVAGEVTIRDWLGREVGKQEINIGAPLLPSAGRNYAVNINLQKKLLLPGLYDSEVKIKYGLTGQKAVAMENVWYIPFYAWIVLLVLCAIGVALVKKRKN